jgi:hypothetical protein
MLQAELAERAVTTRESVVPAVTVPDDGVTVQAAAPAALAESAEYEVVLNADYVAVPSCVIFHTMVSTLYSLKAAVLTAVSVLVVVPSV